jgi:hypothetical protein
MTINESTAESGNQPANEPTNDPASVRMYAAMNALEAAHSADPRTHSFGIFTSDPHPWGVGMFHWFATRAALAHALAHDFVFALVHDEGNDHSNDAAASDTADAISARVQALMQSFGVNAAIEGENLTKLRAAFRGVQDIGWVGTFEQLCESADPWPSELRESFRGHHSEDESLLGANDLTRAIELSELDDFVEFIEHYGF